MEIIVFRGPDGVERETSRLDWLHEIILSSGRQYWATASAAASLRIMIRNGERLQWLTKQPSLEFFLHEPFGYHFNYFGPDVELTPLVGDKGKPWVAHVSAGKTMHIPVGCFVGREIAWQIVEEFCRSRQPSPVVPWNDWWELDLPFGPVALEDLASAEQPCPNHRRTELSIEEYESQAMHFAARVERARQRAIAQCRTESSELAELLQAAEVWPKIEGLGIDSTAVALPDPSGQGRHILSYTWDWLEAHDEAAIAADLVEKLREQ